MFTLLVFLSLSGLEQDGEQQTAKHVVTVSSNLSGRNRLLKTSLQVPTRQPVFRSLVGTFSNN